MGSVPGPRPAQGWRVGAPPAIPIRRGGQMGGAGPPDVFREIDAEGRLGRLGRHLLRRILALQQPQQLLPLLFILGLQMDGIDVGRVSVQGILGADHVDLSDGDQRKHQIDERRDGGQSQGRYGGRGPLRSGWVAHRQVVRDVEQAENTRPETWTTPRH